MEMETAARWKVLYEDWQKTRADHAAAEKRLDDAMTCYLEAKGPPPARESLISMAGLKQKMLESRKALDALIENHAPEHREKHNLPRHE